MRWTMQRQFRKCGKQNCRTCPHGPYWYGYRHVHGHMESKYFGRFPPDQEEVENPEELTLLVDQGDQDEPYKTPPAVDFPEVPPAEVVPQFDGEEAFAILGLSFNRPFPARETVRKRVWNLLKRKTLTDAQKGTIKEAWLEAMEYLE